MANGIFLTLYSDGAGSIIFLGVTLVIQIFFSYHVVYLHDFTLIDVGANILIIMIWVCGTVLTSHRYGLRHRLTRRAQLYQQREQETAQHHPRRPTSLHKRAKRRLRIHYHVTLSQVGDVL